MEITRRISNLRIQRLQVGSHDDELVEEHPVTERDLILMAYSTLFNGFHGDDDAWADARFQVCEDIAKAMSIAIPDYDDDGAVLVLAPEGVLYRSSQTPGDLSRMLPVPLLRLALPSFRLGMIVSYCRHRLTIY